MTSVDSAYVGIDPASSHQSLAYAVLDRELNVLNLGNGSLDEILSSLEGIPSVLVAVNAPATNNLGLVKAMLEKDLGESQQVRGADLRVCEYILRERGIIISGTPSSGSLIPPWMEAGFELYRELEDQGFVNFSGVSKPHQILETHPHACYCVMIGRVPFAKSTLEGRLQRQLVLYERGVRISDPMDFFEEITRYKIIHGRWPMELVYSPEQLDVLVAAYTAWVAVHRTDHLQAVGDRTEGRIYLPEKDLIEKY